MFKKATGAMNQLLFYGMTYGRAYTVPYRRLIWYFDLVHLIYYYANKYDL